MTIDEPDARRAIGEVLALLQRGQAAQALELVDHACRQHPSNLDLMLHRALALRMLGRLPDALRALDETLAIDPYFFLALMSKGAVLERIGTPRRAALVYRDALKIAPTDGIPAPLEAAIGHAREVVAEDSRALATHLREALDPLRSQHATASLARLDECLDIYAGTKRVHEARPVQLHVPRLPAIPFPDRDQFPWLPRLESATSTIRAELSTLLEEGMPGFAPYIAYPPGTPVNQFAELNHSRLWSSLWLWRDGGRQDEAIARCPKTAAMLETLPLADQPGHAPTVVFSALAARTRIPPHHGSTNARLLVHLPLVLPGPAGFRVGNETRQWRMGEAWVFDDTIEHEAWNRSAETRVILLFDVWRPELSQEERSLVVSLFEAIDAHGGGRKPDWEI
jgi:aspartate beta-hydroxylase